MRCYPGGPAWTESALARFNLELKQQDCGLLHGVQLCYFVEFEQELTDQEEQRLKRLLHCAESDQPSKGRQIWVVPRLGTISPWSSKATEIIQQCGLTAVRRVEHGLEYCFEQAARIPMENVHDRMTQSVLTKRTQAEGLFVHEDPRPLAHIDFHSDARQSLIEANQNYGLALSEEDLDYLIKAYRKLERGPTDAELMMFAQVNSEHCRHKIFNARWIIDGQEASDSLFDMIRHTHAESPLGTWSAYQDNAAVLEGGSYSRWGVDPISRHWQAKEGRYGLVIKVETHNHPTGISPFPGAATGSGGEIRDESACGRGGQPKAGLCGFTVSEIDPMPSTPDLPPPKRLADPETIMVEAPVGAASFNNEFGRPNLCGFFRTLLTEQNGQLFGYHKPIMIAGGMGSIPESQVEKQPLPAQTPIVVLGGPAMLIGLGGGATSSLHTGASEERVDYASVQRSNPEMQHRAQEVIEQCVSLGEDNPILSIHDVGAGGLSNALPELVHAGGEGGAVLELREIPTAEPALSPRELWCNESQERYVLAICADRLAELKQLCERENCPYAVVGHATTDGQLRLNDRLLGEPAVDLPMAVLFGESPGLVLNVASVKQPEKLTRPTLRGDIKEYAQAVLSLPSVGSKSFLITIGDRTVGGLTARDQMVGPWQVPVADAAATCSNFKDHSGEAMAIGERPLLALHQPAASARMAIAEALTNLASTRVRDRQQVRLSANWMAASGDPEQLYKLRQAVEAVRNLCPKLGLSIPVGKDSLSMQTTWDEYKVTSPVSLVVSAFAPVDDVRRHRTAQLQPDPNAELFLLALNEEMRLGCSAWEQSCSKTFNSEVPDVDDPAKLAAFFDLTQGLLDDDLVLAYHDRSDGGLLSALCECAFAGRVGLQLDIAQSDYQSYLFNEELGAVVQTAPSAKEELIRRAQEAGLVCHRLGHPAEGDRLELSCQHQPIATWPMAELNKWWSSTSYRIALKRDEQTCVDLEYAQAQTGWNGESAPLSAEVPFDLKRPLSVIGGAKPEMVILREQGVNSQAEMAAAFTEAGFLCRDVHMRDLHNNPDLLKGARGLAVCGGFSYGDVLGAGSGWAKNILFHRKLSEIFSEFFNRPDVFALGVCNGCQMMSQLHELIPGADHWPNFVANRSQQFEARLSQVEVVDSPSILLQGMQGTRIPIVVSHREGQMAPETDLNNLKDTVCLRYIDQNGDPTQSYPANPNGSADGVTGLTSIDGRFTILMPHPERVFRTVQFSWHPPQWGEFSPWLRVFQNARTWVDKAG